MGRRQQGPEALASRVTIRLTESERELVEFGRAARGLDVSDYVRTLVREDTKELT